MRRTFYGLAARPVIVIVAILFPITVWGAVLALQSNRNDVKEWLPESFQATRDYNAFQQHFGNETFVLVSWDGCTLDDERLDRFAELLSPARSAPGAAYFDKVTTGRDLMERLTTAPTRLADRDALARLEGSFVGPDGHQTCAALTLSKFGNDHLRAALDEIYRVATGPLGIERASIRMGGPPVDNVAIDVEGERMLLPLMILSAVVGLALAWWCLRDWRLTAMVFIGGVYSAAISLALVYALGGTINSVLLTMPSVVYTAGLSAAIHIINYYRHVRAQEGPIGATERGVQAAWLPCGLSAGTAAIGLISLCTSDLVPIRNFGFYSALGVVVALVFMFLYLPSALELWPPAVHLGSNGNNASALDPAHRRRMRRLGTTVVNHPRLIWTTFLVMMFVCGAGLHRAKTTINLMSLFSPDAEIIHSYRWLEAGLGPLVPMEVVVKFDGTQARSNMVERMQLVERLQNDIRSIPSVGSVMSAVTFAPELTTGKSSRGLRGVIMNEASYRAVLNRRLLAHRQDFVRDAYIADDPATGQELWRISLRVAALADIDYGAFIDQIKEKVEPRVQAEKQNSARGLVGVTYTGLTPVVYMAERALLNGLIDSFFGAFLMIGAVMSLVFRDIRAGFLTMLPNVWPMAVVFGLMSWFGIALDIGTMMTASVAMGVCVDDTVHFANWFRRATRLGLNHRDASILAFENSAGAIYQSTVIVALGLATFTLSTFMPTRRFGLLMCTLLGFGLLADLTLPPVMLGSYLGRFFTVGCRRPPTKEREASADEENPRDSDMYVA